MRRHARGVGLACVVALLAACDSAVVRAAPDLGTRDAGARDSGATSSDSGAPDTAPADPDAGETSVDATMQDASDSGPPSSCVRDDDCGEGRVCALVPNERSERLVARCADPEPGSLGIGDACAPGAVCTNGLTCLAGYCRALCGGIDDCGAEETCSRGAFSLHGFESCSLVSFVGVCHRPCRSPRDCSASETCFLVAPVTGGEVANGMCFPTDPAWIDTGEPCSATTFCQHALCAPSGLCTERCLEDGDCPAGFVCTPGFRWRPPCEVTLTTGTCEPG